MNWKLPIVGGVVFYVVMFALSMVSGLVIHEGILDEPYRATHEFWRPELTQDPPDMASLMPRWIATGLITTVIFVGIYGLVRPALGKGWFAGVKFGALLGVIGCCMMAGWSGVFNLPGTIWFWWGVEQLALYTIGGAALGWVGEKLSPRRA